MLISRLPHAVVDGLFRAGKAKVAQTVADRAGVGNDNSVYFAIQIARGLPPQEPNQSERGEDEQRGVAERDSD
jgi:hypothetical protein